MVFMLDPKKFSDFPPEPTVDGSEIIPIVKDGQNSSVTVETLQQLVDVITDHGQLGGLSDDDHAQYALADGSRGNFATPGQGALADTALQNISGQDLSTADNTTSAFITAADVPAETDPVFAASSAASITPTDITHLADLDSAAYEPSTAFAPALGVDDNYVTDAEKVVIGNTSGTNTGDNAVNSNYSGLAASKQDTLVSGTNLKTINSTSLLGAGDMAISGISDHTLLTNIGTRTHAQLETDIAGKFTQRTITGTTNQITVTNGDGVAGNPTLSLPQDIHTGASPTFNTVTASLTGLASLNLPLTGGTLSGILNTSATFNSRSIIPWTDSAYTLGTSSLYWSNTYTDRLYLNATAYLDGGTAGMIVLPSGQLNIPLGSYTAPSLTFSGITNSGFYATSSPEIYAVLGGVKQMTYGAGYITFAQNQIKMDNALTDATAATISVYTGAAFTPFLQFRKDSLANAQVWFPNGLVGIGTTAPTSKLDINSDNLRVRTAKTPASATATGTQGQICWDANYVYVCTATNTWKRSAIATW